MSTVGRGIVYGQAKGTSTVTGIKVYKFIAFQYASNPFTSKLQVHIAGKFTYKVTDLVGATVETGKGSGTALIGESCQPGIFFLTVQNNTSAQTVKIIKKKLLRYTEQFVSYYIKFKQ